MQPLRWIRWEELEDRCIHPLSLSRPSGRSAGSLEIWRRNVVWCSARGGLVGGFSFFSRRSSLVGAVLCLARGGAPFLRVVLVWFWRWSPTAAVGGNRGGSCVRVWEGSFLFWSWARALLGSGFVFGPCCLSLSFNPITL
ncbi:unnamed protein product [Linum tenue]|uniref:Uncharacterized protein n=1 Tax=Linum tenue TaxID=586396 RepID=A0AAV0HCT9_9ROSI|nr:unnamed protein product [Linum tenue]